MPNSTGVFNSFLNSGGLLIKILFLTIGLLLGSGAFSVTTHFQTIENTTEIRYLKSSTENIGEKQDELLKQIMFLQKDVAKIIGKLE